MKTSTKKPLHLRRIDPSQNIQRFYCLPIQPTLFGGTSLVGNWGRIGTNGQEMMATFDECRAAEEAMSRLEQTKRRRGYREPEARDNR
ncbi:Hypothetical protein NGAL_HAMBI2605_29730 [Neorhizobium galegae bv. orientalis]|nr:Hypothetical protein NGAL_HAMBI2605_29730 [Neorhizobium galegae bv. orientalis]